MRSLALVLAFITTSVCVAPSAGPRLVYERIYSASRTDQVLGQAYSYLMFYADGTVIGTTSKQTSEEIKSWFTRDNAKIGRGVFELKGNHLKFSLTVQTGVLAYDGVLEGDRLVVEAISLVDRKRLRYVYFLVNSAAEQAEQWR
jgi:hypothetical protein